MKKFGLFLLAAFTLLIPLVASVASAAPSFADPNFQRTWERTDKILTERTDVDRGYIWGPESVFTGQENYSDAPGGQRTVQYWDKARMEVNNPGGDRNDPNFVTSGLLVKEMVLGRQQNGNEVTNFTAGNPSEVQVAGDPNSGSANAVSPTYRSFRNVATFNNDNPSDPKLGQQVTQTIDKAGNVTTITPPDPNVRLTAYESSTKHNIADVFISYGNRQGLIWNGSTYVTGPLFSPSATYVFGLPITEPYWIRAVVGGVEKDVLVQLFERRTLTYTQSNDEKSKVEMGNVGRHYFRWRYVDNLGRGTGTPTTTPPTTTPPAVVPSNDYSQFRAPYLKTGNVPQGGAGNVQDYPTGGAAINSSPVYNPNTKLAIVGTAGGGLVAVNLSTFNTPVQQWKFQPTGVNFNSPVVLFNGVVYSGASDNRIYAVRESDGMQVWRSAPTGGPVTSQVALDTDSAYFISNDGKGYAVNLSDGSPKFQFNQPAGVNLTNSFIIGTDGTLYATGSDNKIHAFNKTGTELASTSFSTAVLDGVLNATPSFANGRIYVGTDNGTLYAINTNGTIQTQKTFTVGKAIRTTPAFANVGGSPRVYVGTDDGKVYGVDANNVATILFTFDTGAAVVRSSVAVVDNFVYFGSDNKNVYRVEAANQANSIILTTTANPFGTNSVVVNSGLVIIPSNDGVLHIIK